MRLSVIKILTLLFFFVAVVPISKVSALDNDQAGQDCVIKVGGVETKTGPGSAILYSTSTKQDSPFVPTLSPSNPSDLPVGQNYRDYNLEICGIDSAVLTSDRSRHLVSNERVVANLSVRYLNFGFQYTGVTVNLSPSGNCLVGTFSAPVDNFSIDIETENSKTPICRREHGFLSNMNQSHLESFDNAMSNFCDYISLTPENPNSGEEFSISFSIPESFRTGDSFGRFIGPNNRSQVLHYSLEDPNKNQIERVEAISANNTQSFSRSYTLPVASDYTVSVWLQDYAAGGRVGVTGLCGYQFNVGTPTNPGNINRRDSQNNINPFNLCDQIPKEEGDFLNESSAHEACKTCLAKPGIWTALGCIPTDGAGTVRTFISIALGMAGGIGLLMIIAAGAMFALSQNDPTKVNSARDLLTSVIIGLLFIVFSVTILQFIGVTILQIPGFGT